MEARYSIKRSMSWVGYKVHLTESCDVGFPRLITGVRTTTATATDVKQLTPIQDVLAASGVLPAEQLADSSYVCGSNLGLRRAGRSIPMNKPTVSGGSSKSGSHDRPPSEAMARSSAVFGC